jgi:CMP-N,N'-diacetyllegionaminic acid synthase
LKILGIIPARAGSKGVPGKNKKMLGGKPLVFYSLQAAKKSKLLTHIFVSTNDADVKKIAEQNNIKVPELRPEHLSTSSSPSLDYINYTLELLKKQGLLFDAVCLLQPTSPFRTKGLVDACIKKFIETGADTLFTTRPVPAEFNPHWIFEPSKDGLKLSTGEKKIISRRQDLPAAYYRDGSIYIIKTSVLLKGTLYGKKIVGYENNAEPFVNIDTIDDWKEAVKKVKLYKI